MESEERGAPGPLYLRALGFSTTRAQLPQKPHKTRTGGFALRAKKEFTQSSRFAFLSLCLHLRRKNTPVCEHLKQVEVEVELGGELGGIFLLSLPPQSR